jgi:hypothetical protein
MKNTDKLKKVKKSKEFSNIAVAMIAGAVTGAVLGILYAPSKGKKLRKKINRFTKYIKTDLLNYRACDEKTIPVPESEIGNWKEPQRVDD